jgi:hypothetical protein
MQTIYLSNEETFALMDLVSSEIGDKILQTNIALDVLHKDLVDKGIIDKESNSVYYQSLIDYLVEFIDKKLYYAENRYP